MKNINIKIDSKSKIILTSAASLIFIGLTYYFIINGSFASIKATEDKIIIDKINLDKKYTESISQKQFMTKMKMVDSQLQKLDSIYINKNLILDFVTTIEGMAAANQVEQKISIADTPKSSGGPVKTSINLTARGGFRNVLNFLGDLDSLTYYINISFLDIQKTPDGVFMNINADAYVK